MSVSYKERVLKATNYIECNIDKKLKLVDIAAQVNISAFHFHRIFKLMQNETLGNFIRRLRLQRAASELLINSHKPITDIALDLGFSSSQNLAKAFQQYFGLTPSDIKRCENINELQKIFKNSKLGNIRSKNRNDLTADSQYHQASIHHSGNTMKTESFNSKKLIAVRVVGPYGQGLEQAYQDLYGWAEPRHLDNGDNLIIYRDNPEFTPADKCRADVCLIVEDNSSATGDILKLEIPAGNYAVLEETITAQEQYGQAWDKLIQAIIDAKLEMADNRPCFEYYHKFNAETKEADVSFYNAIV